MFLQRQIQYGEKDKSTVAPLLELKARLKNEKEQ